MNRTFSFSAKEFGPETFFYILKYFESNSNSLGAIHLIEGLEISTGGRVKNAVFIRHVAKFPPPTVSWRVGANAFEEGELYPPPQPGPGAILL